MDIDLSVALNQMEAIARGAVRLLPNLLIAVAVFTVFWFLGRLVSSGLQNLLRRTHQPPNVAVVLSRVARWAVLAFGLLTAMTVVVPSLNASTLLGALGVGGVAIGFAFKDIFQNLLAGILLLVTRPFMIGDQIVSGSHEGTVEDIQVRATLLRTFDNRLVVIPNSDLYTNRVEVNTANARRRGQVMVGIGYNDSIEQAKEVILRELNALGDVILLDPPPAVVVRELGDSAVKLSVRFWVGPPRRSDLVRATDAVISRIKPALQNAGIEIPFPTQTLMLPPGNGPEVFEGGSGGSTGDSAAPAAPGAAVAATAAPTWPPKGPGVASAPNWVAAR